MSGGVDSSVAAALLVEQGYEVVGMMMRLWSEPGRGPNAPQNRCCTPDQMADARYIAGMLDIPFYVLDVQDYFRDTIVQFFIDEHLAGRTPNPCIRCNREVRFNYLLNRALALDGDFLATGHYARIERDPAGRFRLRRGKDSQKDQSYVLHVLDQDALAHTLFPVGDYTKDEVRALAQRFGLPLAQKQESQDLCFLGDNDYRRFLREYAPQSSRPGAIMTRDGETLGTHQGLPFYTIGQRKGLGISYLEPLYVLEKDVARNALVVGPRAQLGRTELIAHQVNWVAGEPPPAPLSAEVKIRYKARPVPATVTPLNDRQVRVVFTEPVLGITAGQGAVFYDDDYCLGGGLIQDRGLGQNSGSFPESESAEQVETGRELAEVV
jgi:tRNA-specific 2-thiouridylase